MFESKKLSISVFALVIICVCLCITSFALGYATYEVRANMFMTGGIDIDLNGGMPIITANEFNFEPGMTVEKPCYIQNNSSDEVYYKLYFSQVSGDLGDILDITVLDRDGNTLLTGKLSALTEKNVPALEDELGIGEKKDLRIQFHYPEEAGNETQDQELTFVLSAVAVQKKNNPNKEFN